MMEIDCNMDSMQQLPVFLQSKLHYVWSKVTTLMQQMKAHCLRPVLVREHVTCILCKGAYAVSYLQTYVYLWKTMTVCHLTSSLPTQGSHAGVSSKISTYLRLTSEKVFLDIAAMKFGVTILIDN